MSDEYCCEPGYKCCALCSTFSCDCREEKMLAKIARLEERCAGLAAALEAVIVGAKSAFKPHGAVICSSAHEPLTIALNKAIEVLNDAAPILARVRAGVWEEAAAYIEWARVQPQANTPVLAFRHKAAALKQEAK